MPGDNGFLVEDFIDAITTQLDRVQDTLRLKAVNRPLTYALKDLQLDLKVFIDMDSQGHVRFRSAGAEDTGASVVHFGFTTITKPMIEENTISMTAARSASLDELGLKPDEQRRLARMGVSNLAQLQKLGSSAGVGTVARLTNLPLERIRAALQQGAPAVHAVQPAPRVPRAVTAPAPVMPLPRNPSSPSPWSPVTTSPARSTSPSPTPAPSPSPIVSKSPILRIPAGSSRMTLLGRNLMAGDMPPSVTLNGEPLAIHEHDPDRIVVELPPAARAGALALQLGDAEPLHYELALDGGALSAPDAAVAAHDDWSPES